MAINPDEAARNNDARIQEFKEQEQERIDGVLCEKHYTGGPPVEVEPSEHEIEGVVRDIMRIYNEAGWRIEVISRPTPENATRELWSFRKNTR